MANDLEQLVLSISADTRQMQRALARLTGDTQKAADSVDAAFGKAPPKIDAVSKSLGKTRADTANLAAQFQDIAVQLQGGQSPFTIALQQGTQISAVLGQQGAGGAVSLLGTAFQSLLNPVSLGTIAIIALGGAAVQYATKAIGGVEDLGTLIKENTTLIDALKGAWGDAAKDITTSTHEVIGVLRTLTSLKGDALAENYKKTATSIAASLQPTAAAVDDLGRVITTTPDRFAAFRGPIDDFQESVRKGTPDVLAFRRGISDIVETTTDQKVRALGGELLKMTDTLKDNAISLEENRKALRNLDPAMVDAKKSADAFTEAMKKLNGTVTPDLTTRQQIMENYNKALVAAGSTEDRLAAARARDDQLAILSANERKKAAEDANKEAESAQKRFDSALNSTARQVAAMRGAAQGVGLGAGALVEFETQSRLTEAAQQSLGKITEETAAKIRAQAEAAGIAADALAKAKVASQIDFASKTAFLSDDDVKLARQLAPIFGNDVTAALNSSYAAALQLNDALRGISSSLSNDLTSGLTDIVSGSKSAKDGFADMAASIIKDIERMIIKLTIVGPLMRALQGGFGSLLGGGQTMANPYASMPMAGVNFDSGGYTGAGGKHTPAGIVHKGEVVFSQRDVARAGGVGAVESMRLRGYADGGIVTPSLPSVPRGAGSPQFTFNVSTPAGTTVQGGQFKPDGRGGGSMEIAVKQMVAGAIMDDVSKNGPITKVLKSASRGFSGT